LSRRGVGENLNWIELGWKVGTKNNRTWRASEYRKNEKKKRRKLKMKKNEENKN